jgi:hypothetical protein
MPGFHTLSFKFFFISFLSFTRSAVVFFKRKKYVVVDGEVGKKEKQVLKYIMRQVRAIIQQFQIPPSTIPIRLLLAARFGEEMKTDNIANFPSSRVEQQTHNVRKPLVIQYTGARELVVVFVSCCLNLRALYNCFYPDELH